MNYKKALTYLNSFIDYEKIGYKNKEAFNLGRIRKLARLFGNPEKSFPAVHIAGTKGKGSTASFVAGILEEAGFRTGLYTSPHLTDIRERVKINGGMIGKNELAYHAGKIKRKLEKTRVDFSPTFFEIYTILAFNYFREQKIDYGAIEVGLGGRLDATNIVSSLVSVIAPVSRDHTRVLGSSLKKIAFEKAGIVKNRSLCISAPQEKEALSIIRKECHSRRAGFFLVGKDVNFEEVKSDSKKELFNIRGLAGTYRHLKIRLLGRHQLVNAAAAVGAIEALRKRGVKIPEEAVKKGLEKTVNPARCEVKSKKPFIVVDGAHNRRSARALRQTLKRNFKYKRLILVLGISKEKDIKGILEELLPPADKVILTKAKQARAEDPRSMKKFIKKEVIIIDSVEEAVQKARSLALRDDLILITGSFFVACEVKIRDRHR